MAGSPGTTVAAPSRRPFRHEGVRADSPWSLRVPQWRQRFRNCLLAVPAAHPQRQPPSDDEPRAAFRGPRRHPSIPASFHVRDAAHVPRGGGPDAPRNGHAAHCRGTRRPARHVVDCRCLPSCRGCHDPSLRKARRSLRPAGDAARGLERLHGGLCRLCGGSDAHHARRGPGHTRPGRGRPHATAPSAGSSSTTRVGKRPEA